MHGMCEDYRAGLRIDQTREEATGPPGSHVTCPMLFLQSAHDDIDIHGDPIPIWQPWVDGPPHSSDRDRSGTTELKKHPTRSRQPSPDFLA